MVLGPLIGPACRFVSLIHKAETHIPPTSCVIRILGSGRDNSCRTISALALSVTQESFQVLPRETDFPIPNSTRLIDAPNRRAFTDRSKQTPVTYWSALIDNISLSKADLGFTGRISCTNVKILKRHLHSMDSDRCSRHRCGRLFHDRMG